MSVQKRGQYGGSQIPTSKRTIGDISTENCQSQGLIPESKYVLCLGCNQESGFLVLCHTCRKTTKQSEALWKNATKKWHRIVCRDSDYIRCTYCKKLFPKNQICGDHYIPKSVRPDLRFDVRNGNPCCMRCNTPGIKPPYDPTIFD